MRKGPPPAPPGGAVPAWPLVRREILGDFRVFRVRKDVFVSPVEGEPSTTSSSSRAPTGSTSSP